MEEIIISYFGVFLKTTLTVKSILNNEFLRCETGVMSGISMVEDGKPYSEYSDARVSLIIHKLLPR